MTIDTHTTGLILERWQHRSQTLIPNLITILPDGCRDVICTIADDATVRWHVSPFFAVASQITLLANSTSTGYRLAPGTLLDSRTLLSKLQQLQPDTQATIALVEACATRSHTAAEILDYLAEHPGPVTRAANELGVSARTLQRAALTTTGHSPGYWLRLARIRKAARQITAGISPIHVAFDSGFADQPHLVRECRHWLGVTPSMLLRRPELGAQLQAPAFA